MNSLSKADVSRLRSLLRGDQEPGAELQALLQLLSLLRLEEDALARKRDGDGGD